MVIVTVLYGALVYLLFFKFKVLPWNKISQGLITTIGVIILTAFLIGLQGLTPASVQGEITGQIAEIAPQVSGRVITVEAKPNVQVEEVRHILPGVGVGLAHKAGADKAYADIFH